MAHLFWPTQDDFAGHRVGPNLAAAGRESCAELVRRTLRPAFLPHDLADRLVGLRKWRFGSDFAVGRYSADGRRIQLIVSAHAVGVLVGVGGDGKRARAGSEYALKVAKDVLAPLEDFDAAQCEARGGSIEGFCLGAIWCKQPPGPGSPWSVDVAFVTDGASVFLMIHPRALDVEATQRDLAGPPAPWPPAPKLLFDE
jgi:hypothetical protein